MKPSEILASMPKWAAATPADIVASPAWAMPCRLGDAACTMRLDAIRASDTLDVAIKLEDEPHVLSLVDTPQFADLHRIWASRSEVPEPILLALVEKECGPLLQLVENAVRRQLKVVGLSPDGPGEDALFAQVEGVSFGLSRSNAVVAALGQLRFIDVGHASVRDEEIAAETEFASFTLPAEDRAALSVGDDVLLPEIGSVPPRLVADGRFLVDGNGVSRYSDDGRLRVLDADSRTISLGLLFDQAQTPSEIEAGEPSQLRIVSSGKTVATGHLGKLAGQNVFVVEAVDR